MSAEHMREESRRWMEQARSDVAAAMDSTKAGHFNWACFQAQQAAEKAMKSVWYQLDLDPWGHSVAKLVDGLPHDLVGDNFEEANEPARHLDKLYIPTRYPNGLPGITPTEAYDVKDAESAIAAAERILTLVRQFISAVLGRGEE
ncbi:MAG TPA: HEPN domain-containing protein [Candidatus Sumerlaeota bacterium]|nr:HEPN domain-containing protein [Candidatus Sumerlaeota bacterium]